MREIIKDYEAIQWMLNILHGHQIASYLNFTTRVNTEKMFYGKDKNLYKFSFCSYYFQFILLTPLEAFLICLKEVETFPFPPPSLFRFNTLITLSPWFKLSHNVSDGCGASKKVREWSNK